MLPKPYEQKNVPVHLKYAKMVGAVNIPVPIQGRSRYRKVENDPIEPVIACSKGKYVDLRV